MFCEKESLQEREGALAVNIRWTQQIGQACDWLNTGKNMKSYFVGRYSLIQSLVKV